MMCVSLRGAPIKRDGAIHLDSRDMDCRTFALFWLAMTMLVIASFSNAHAESELIDRYLPTTCQPTPALGTTNYPGFKSIMSSNKLGMPPGKSVFANGQPVYVFARVFDANCVPAGDAKVELWHADPEGRYRFATKAALATPDAVFAGAGRTTTDNLGEFFFLTVYPGPYEYYIYVNKQKILVRRAPHFNLRISHRDLGTYQTSVYFEGDHRNPTDDKLKKLDASSQALVMMDVGPRYGDWNQGVQAHIDIVLPTKSPWKKY